MRTTTYIKYLDGTTKSYNGTPKNIKVFDKRAENAKTIEINKYSGRQFFKKDNDGIWATAIKQNLDGKYWRFILVPKKVNYSIEHQSIDNETASAIIGKETEELMEKARAAVEWCDPKDEKDEKGRYWLSLYHGSIDYLLIVKDGRIKGAIAEGYEASRREVFTCEQSFWNAVYNVIEEKLGPEYHLLQAEGSGTYFYLKDEDDAKYLPTENYAVPSENGVLHYNTEVKSIKSKQL